ncbi:hypothetical protein TNCV_4386541 [Trichonephila clavipes]|nr:hypothetical protein TNCV_4386541 [Trichonephila clavipes]
MPKRKRGITGDAALRWRAIRERERRAAETVEERNKRLSAMAQRGREERRKRKNKEVTDWQPWHNVTRREDRRKGKNKEVTNCQPWRSIQEDVV